MDSSGWDGLTERLEHDLGEVVIMHGKAEARTILGLQCVLHRSHGDTRMARESAALAVMREAVSRLDSSYDDADRDAVSILLGLASGTRELPAEARYERIAQRYREWNEANPFDHGRKPTGLATIRQRRRAAWVRLMAEELTEMERRETGEATLEGLEPATARAERAEVSLDWETFGTMLEHVASKLAAFEPDLVVGVARGGLPLAVALCHRLGVRNLGTVFIRKYQQDGAFAPPGRVVVDGVRLPAGAARRVVIVDDIVSVGDTILAAESYVREQLPGDVVVGFASLVADTPRLRQHRPELFAAGVTFVYAMSVDNAATWVTFPWEASAVA